MAEDLRGLTADTVVALFSQTVEPTAILATITADGLDGPLRLVNVPAGQTSTGRPGLVSRGVDFEFFPFNFAFGGAGQGEAIRDAKVEIGNRSGGIAEALEGVTGQPSITFEMVRVAAPDGVELAMSNATLTDHEESGPKITGTIKPRRFDTEPACKKSYLPCNTPAQF